jgi:putative transposase
MKFAWIEANRSTFSVKGMCGVLDVSQSGLYDFLSRPESARSLGDRKIVDEIKTIHEDVDGIYGSPRMTTELKARGYEVNEKRTARLMQKEAISARNPKIFRVKTTDSNHDLPIAPDLVQRNFAPGKQNVIWVTDITYIETVDGFVYLTTVLDLGNREIVGWYLSDNLRTEGVAKALIRAIARKTPPDGLIVHSDRGVQFASVEFRDLLTEHKLCQSMSRKGNCYDNAVQESFFHSLKTERLYRLGFVPTIKELQRILFDYIEVFYNRKRRHSSLGYLSPVDYAKQIAS